MSGAQMSDVRASPLIDARYPGRVSHVRGDNKTSRLVSASAVPPPDLLSADMRLAGWREGIKRWLFALVGIVRPWPAILCLCDLSARPRCEGGVIPF